VCNQGAISTPDGYEQVKSKNEYIKV